MLTGFGTFRASLRAGLAAGALFFSMPDGAQAQWFGFRYGHTLDDYEPYSFYNPRYRAPPVAEELEPREIVAALAARGFSRISRPVYSDNVAIVRAVNPNGRPMIMTINIFSGRIIDRVPDSIERRTPPPPRVVQRAPDQGPTIRRTVPETTAPARAAPAERPPEVRREPVTPPLATPPAPPRRERIVRPEAPAQPAKPPEASAGTGTRAQPRRIEIAPPAPLDAPPAPAPKRPEPPINSVPPAALE